MKPLGMSFWTLANKAHVIIFAHLGHNWISKRILFALLRFSVCFHCLISRSKCVTLESSLEAEECCMSNSEFFFLPSLNFQNANVMSCILITRTRREFL